MSTQLNAPTHSTHHRTHPSPPPPRRASFTASTGGRKGKTTHFGTHCSLPAPANASQCSGCRLQVEVSRVDLSLPLSLDFMGGVGLHHDP